MNALPVSSFRLQSPFLCDDFSGSLTGLRLKPREQMAFEEAVFWPVARRRRDRMTREQRSVGDRTPRARQDSLSFHLPMKIVTPLMQKVLDIVLRVAFARLAMPTNAEMGSVLGNGRQSIAKAFDRLVAMGRLRVEVKSGYRRVYVVSRQTLTGWGEHRIGHAPYSRIPRGTPEQDLPRPPPAPLGPGDGFKFLGIQSFEEFQYRQALTGSGGSIAPTRQCQYIEGVPEIFRQEFCNRPSMPGKSWCGEHLKLIFL